jgi:hypothetical protein
MSTLAYGALTTWRINKVRAAGTSAAPPDISTYIDMVAALVPAEVLAIHSLIVSYATKIQPDPSGNPMTVITDAGTLRWSFFGLLAMSVVFYLAVRPRKMREKRDFWRAIIPPFAFVAWTMLQRATAFDAVCPKLREAPRVAIALFAAVILGKAAQLLARRAGKP